MTADTRGFRYALAAARQRASHTVEVAMSDLQGAHAQVREALRALSEIDWRRQSLLAHWRASAQRELVPEQSIVLARHLAALDIELARQSNEVQRHERQRHEAIAAAARRKAQFEALDRDRAACLKAFFSLRSRREQARMDQEWLARRLDETCR